MKNIHFNFSKIAKNNIDYNTYLDVVNNQLLLGNRPFFISDWNSGPDVVHLNKLLDTAFSIASDHIDDYYSNENSFDTFLISNKIHKEYNIHLNNKQITIANNATSLICLYVQSLISAGIKNFLALSPVYFSFTDAIEMLGGTLTIIQPTFPDLIIDFEDLKSTIINCHINAIIITQPFFGFGKKITEKQLKQLFSIAKETDCIVILDMARAGLDWRKEKEGVEFGAELQLLTENDKFALIYSPCKQIFANGIKTAIMITSNEMTNRISNMADSFIGSISSAQIYFLKLLLDDKNSSYIENCITKNKASIYGTFEQIKTALLGSNIKYWTPDMGNYMVIGLEKRQTDFNTFCMLLNENGLYTLPQSLYYFFDDKYYLFRVNLLLDKCNLINSTIALSKAAALT